MWLITPIGFFSVVRKPTGIKDKTLTVRARVKEDLETLKSDFLSELGEIRASKTNDYRYRAIAPQAATAKGMASLVEQLDYANFKNEVAQRQGQARPALYHDVWSDLYRLQSPTPLQSWLSPEALAVAVPSGPLPPSLHAVDFRPWDNAPTTIAVWEALAVQTQIAEPEFHAPKGLDSAAGVLILEADSRVWFVCPTNWYGGYTVTFPKGRLDGKSPQATAILEAYEESGLHVRLLRHLIDVRRTTTCTRYYLTERIGGSSANIRWESQCVMLVPKSQLGMLKLKTPDKAVLRALWV